MTKKPFVYVVAGQTACGKTDIGVSLAHLTGGEVVSADSVAVYAGLDIGAAKPTRAQMRDIPHHMIDVANPARQFTVHDYSVLARRATDGILQRGRVPIIVGGTGFYINALLFGTEFFGDDCAPQRSLEQEARHGGAVALHNRLALLDPQAAEKIHPNNIRRTARALAFVQTTGKLFSAHNEQQRARTSLYDFGFYVIDLPRTDIWARIEARTRAIFCGGLLDEVRGLLNGGLPPHCSAINSIGYKQAVMHIMGKISLHEAIHDTIIATRQYAKRQATWFNNSAPPHVNIAAQGRGCDDIAKEIARDGYHV